MCVRSGRGEGTTKMSGGKKGRKEKELDFYVSCCVCVWGGKKRWPRARRLWALSETFGVSSHVSTPPPLRDIRMARIEPRRRGGMRDAGKGGKVPAASAKRACEGTQKRGGGRESAPPLPPLSLSRFAFFFPSAPRSSSTHRILNSQSIKNSPPCRSWAWR